MLIRPFLCGFCVLLGAAPLVATETRDGVKASVYDQLQPNCNPGPQVRPVATHVSPPGVHVARVAATSGCDSCNSCNSCNSYDACNSCGACDACKSRRKSKCKSCGDSKCRGCDGGCPTDCGNCDSCKSKSGIGGCIGNMPPHYPYPAEDHGYYYFRPYNYRHIAEQQQAVTRWGGDPRNPYSNKIFQSIYGEVDADWQPAVLGTISDSEAPSASGNARPMPLRNVQPADVPPVPPIDTTSVEPRGNQIRLRSASFNN